MLMEGYLHEVGKNRALCIGFLVKVLFNALLHNYEMPTSSCAI